MSAPFPPLKKIGMSALEVILGLVCLYLFWGSKHFVLTSPQDPSYQEAPAVVTGKYTKSGGGGRFGGGIWGHRYIAFEVSGSGRRANCDDARVPDHLFTQIKVGDQISAIRARHL
ncbi:MAG: hypothetical protein V3S24_21170, partial [Candidatus Tectomicrobia bacterium]